MLSLYLLRVVSLRVSKRGKRICKEKSPSPILLRRQGLLPVLLQMKAVRLPTLVDSPV